MQNSHHWIPPQVLTAYYDLESIPHSDWKFYNRVRGRTVLNERQMTHVYRIEKNIRWVVDIIPKQLNGSRLLIRRRIRPWGWAIYLIKLISGDWPSDKDLVSICNEMVPAEQRHGKGKVEKLKAYHPKLAAVQYPDKKGHYHFYFHM